MPAIATDLSLPSLYINRELSQLEFNRRVLEQAKDKSLPLLERLRFLTIFSTNLDEFYEIRVASIKEQVGFGLPQTGPDGRSPQDTVREIKALAQRMVKEQYQILQEQILPALAAEGIRLLKLNTWTPDQSDWLEAYFDREILPVLTPIGLDPSHPFPNIQNKNLNLVVALEGKDAFERDSGIAVVQIPRSLPRLVFLPPEVAECAHGFAFLASIVTTFVRKLFPGMNVTGCYQFRVTRDSELWVQEEDVEDLLNALKGELRTRNFGEAVRLEVAESCPQEMSDFLLQKFGLHQDDLYRVDGPVNLHRLATLYEVIKRPDLKFPAFIPGPKRVRSGDAVDIFTDLRRGDILLHHPYESFSQVLELVRQAAADPKVLAIKQTLYRTGAESPMAEALLEAARAGKEVTAVVELRARFDEAANINLATRLQQAGVTVVYGIVGYKTHAKVLLIVRREDGRLRRYVHLGTGNYHTVTTQFYCDFSFLTASEQIGEDVHNVFMQLTGLGQPATLHKLMMSPFTLMDRTLAMIDREAEHARQGRPARIVAKINALTEVRMIEALYRASQAGVTIDLIVRGICCLRPGVPGVSENIRVRSIVGRFLEHHRVYYFLNGGQEQVFCGSADWMSRNLLRRVETGFPIEDPALRTRVVHEGLITYLADNAQAWELQSDGTYVRCLPGGEEPRPAQEVLLRSLSASTVAAHTQLQLENILERQDLIE
jgi:polyphosphate kinase